MLNGNIGFNNHDPNHGGNMNRPLFSLTAKVLFAGVIALCFARTSGATAYYWKGGSSWADYGTLSNWSTEGADGADADALPSAGDGVDRQSCYFDMGGGEYTLGSKTEGSGSGTGQFRVRNGVLHIANSASVQNAGGYVLNGGTLIIDSAATLTLGLWNGGTGSFNVDDGGTLRIDGKVDMWNGQININSGGTFILNGKARFTGDNSSRPTRLRNQGGSMIVTNGLSNTTSANANSPVKLVQTSGSLTLGRNIEDGTYGVEFTISGGSIHVVSDCAVRTATASISGTGLIVEIDEGVAFDITGVTFASGTTITKTGAGDFAFMPGNMPDTLAVNAGALALATANTSYDLSDVTFAAGTKVKIGAVGVTLSNWDSSISSTTFAVADGYIPANGTTVLTIADATLLAQAQTDLNASLAGTGMTVAISGNSLVAEAHYTFASSTVTDLNDVNGWVGGIAAPAGQPAIITGSGTTAVMNDTVPAYSAISVEDGASLTVAATRTLPAATFAAGTALNVTGEVGGIEWESRTYNDYVMDSATLVGSMSPSRGISEITDIAGNIGGGWFGNRDRLYSYVNTKVLDNGAKLRVQFIYNDSDYTKCAFVEFTKDAQGNIYATGVGAGYIQPTAAQVDFDEIEYTSATYGTSDTNGAYGVKKLSFKAPVAYGGPSTVTAVGDFATTGSGNVTVDVADDCVLDLSGVDVTTAATLVKTGDGTIVFGDELPTALNVAEGILVLQPYVEYDMTAVTIANGVTIKVVVDGEYQPCIATPGQNGTTVYMTGDTYVGVGGWDTLANWASGALPNASATAHIFGANTVLTLNAIPATMPAVISLEGGATLKVMADITLPPLAIDPASKVVFGDNATRPTVAAVLDASLTTTADASVTPVALPVIEIATNATLTIPGAMKFKNVDFRLYGTLSKAALDVKGPIFGHAASGETNYIAFTADGCTFDIHADTDRDPTLAQINFLCPDSGGTVKAAGTLVIKNSRRHCNGWNDMGDVIFGEHNPMSEPFDVLLDGTHLDISGRFFAYGAAHISLVNGSYIRREINCLGHGFNMAIGDAATVDVESGCYINFTTGAGAFGIDSQSAVDTVSVRGGGIYSVTANSSGWGRGIFVSDGGILGVHRIYDSRTRTDVLRGFASARLDGDLAIKSLNVYATGGHFSNPNRHAQMADIPFAGAGDVVVTNGVPSDRLSITMVNGANTATGSIRVNKVEGDAETSLFFANGANWAGTVVAGDVSLTNLTDGATAATVDFGALDLAAGKTFPVRVWTHSGPVANDTVNVGQYVNNGGELVPVLADGATGEKIPGGTKLFVGKIAKDSPLPKVPARWGADREPIDGDDAYDMLTMKTFKGLQVILR